LISANSNIAAAVVALLIKKGGTLRLRKSELAEVGDLVLTIQANPDNPDVMHFGTITKTEYETAQAVLQALQMAPIQEEPDGK
jgi:hypothetical protein